MLFRQIIHEDLGCASYLVGDREAGIAAVVDPQWDVEPYRRLARLHGVRIVPTCLPDFAQVNYGESEVEPIERRKDER